MQTDVRGLGPGSMWRHASNFHPGRAGLGVHNGYNGLNGREPPSFVTGRNRKTAVPRA